MFDFAKDRKEKYYKKAEEILSEAGLNCFVINRDCFAIVKNKEVKIYFIPFSKKTVSNEELARAKRIKNLHVVNDRNSKHDPLIGRPIRENAYILFEMDEEDKGEEE